MSAEFQLTLQDEADVKLHYYQSVKPTSTLTPMEVIAYSDAGETQEVDGGGRGGYITKVGPLGSPGGAIHHVTKIIENSYSTPGDELAMLHRAHLALISLRLILGEFSGIYPNPYDVGIMLFRYETLINII